MAKLVYSDQSGWEKSVEVNELNPTVMIGRNPDCAVQTANASVSRVHAMVTWKNGKIFVQDPPNGRPTNGTKVDGMRLQPGQVLELLAGSELVCGNFAIRVESEGPGERVSHMGEQAVSAPSGAGMYQPQQQPGYNGYQPQGRGAAGWMQQNQQMPPQAGPQGPQMPPQQPPMMPQQPMMPQAGPQSPQMPPQQPSVDTSRRSRGNNPRGMGQQRDRSAMSGGNMNHGNDDSLRLQEEISRLQEENQRLQADNQIARQEIDQLRANGGGDNVKELQDKLEERDQILTDYERRIEYHETVVTGLKDMIDKLKEQIDHQKEQYQECRRDLVSSQEEAETLRMELSTLKETLDSKGMATSNAETTIADLKVQLQQKNRMLSDLQRDLDIAQYSCKEERENVEHLKENVDNLNAELEESQRRNRDMKKVVEQHEVMFSELKGNLNDRAREIRQLQDALRKQGGGDNAALMQELSQVRDSLTRRNSEAEMLQKKLDEAIKASSEANAANVTLKARVSELEKGAGGDSSLKDRVSALEKENADLKDKLASGSGGGSVDSGLMERIRGLYSDMNDVVSQWREDLGLLDSSISDLQRVFVAYVKIDISKLQEKDRKRFEKISDLDPKLIFEDIANSLDSSQNSLAAIKEKLKDLRGALQA
ncbi:MAG: FHA domain-containing protein [Proteobacteria bacterium]|nr:FHA domain-containing protein [Pseudomonadota bacterium]MBQ4359696.1 FHA domain-containing protein [Pseudomonadota bacterium]